MYLIKTMRSLHISNVRSSSVIVTKEVSMSQTPPRNLKDTQKQNKMVRELSGLVTNVNYEKSSSKHTVG